VRKVVGRGRDWLEGRREKSEPVLVLMRKGAVGEREKKKKNTVTSSVQACRKGDVTGFAALCEGLQK